MFVNKIDWMLEELHEDGFMVTAPLVERILAGDEPEFVEDSLLDYIAELQREWEAD